MRIDKVSDTSIDFILTRTELIEKNIDIDKLTTEDTYTQGIVYDLMEEAETQHGITIKNNGKFKILISLNKKNEIVISMTSYDPYENKYKFYEQLANQLSGRMNGDDLSEAYSAGSVEEKIRNKLHSNFPNLPQLQLQTPQKIPKSIIYGFDNIESIKMALDDLDINLKNEVLYKYKNRYYLVLHFLKNISKKKMETIFSEYSTPINQSGFDLILQEYGETIIKQDARMVINLYY